MTVNPPFEATLARGGSSLARPGPGWLTLSELAMPAQLERRLERVRLHTIGRGDVAAVWLLERVVELVAEPVLTALLLERRLLDLDPRAVAFHCGEDGLPTEAGAIALRFRTLTSDPERWHPDVHATVADEDELLAILHVQLEAAITPLIAGLHVAGRRSRPALWRSCADVVGSTCLSVGKRLLVVERAVALGTRLLDLAGPMRTPANYRVVELRDGRRTVIRARQGCCLNHVVEPGQTCMPCPLTPESERLRRLERLTPRGYCKVRVQIPPTRIWRNDE